jgi:hypothetical protein
MARCGPDGVSFGAKLAHVERTTGNRPPALDGPEVPLQTAHVLGWFYEISQGRTGTGFGPNPLTWAGIEAWMRLTGTVVHPWEIRLLKGLDRLYLDSLKEN